MSLEYTYVPRRKVPDVGLQADHLGLEVGTCSTTMLGVKATLLVMHLGTVVLRLAKPQDIRIWSCLHLGRCSWEDKREE